MMPNFRYIARCNRCEAFCSSSATSSFLTPFFLPENCSSCGHRKFKSAYSREDSGWYVTYGHEVFVPSEKQPVRSWWKPWTWVVKGHTEWNELSRILGKTKAERETA